MVLHSVVERVTDVCYFTLKLIFNYITLLKYFVLNTRR